MSLKKASKQTLRVVARSLKAGEYKKEEDTLDIFIGNFALHSQTANNPKSLLQNRYRELKGAKPKRTYFNGGIEAKDNGEIEIGFWLYTDEVQDILKKTNNKKLRIFFTAEGVHVTLAPDAIEKIKSLQKKSIKK